MAYPAETSMTEDCFKQWFISATEAHIGRIQKGPDEILRY